MILAKPSTNKIALSHVPSQKVSHFFSFMIVSLDLLLCVWNTTMNGWDHLAIARKGDDTCLDIPVPRKRQ
eukprot:m.113375 g.113375  ORF g.113375 m.113375 type:complete len:70 (+) comp13511_c1_seq7:1740-1949(+)